MATSSLILKTLCLLSLLLVGVALVPGQGAWAQRVEKATHGCCQHDQEGPAKQHEDSDCCHGYCHACCARTIVNTIAAGVLTCDRSLFEVGTIATSQKPADGHLAGIFHPPKA